MSALSAWRSIWGIQISSCRHNSSVAKAPMRFPWTLTKLLHLHGINKACGRYGSVRTACATPRCILSEIQTESVKNIMKIKTINQIVISLLAGASLHGNSFAGPATWVQRSKPTTLPLPRGVSVAFSGHPSKQPYVGATKIGTTRLFSAGQGVVSIPN
jgi:hypothetical protein